MLPKSRRLTTKDFKDIFDRGKAYRGRYFVLRVVSFPAEGPSRFGFSISKKVFKNAVDRNLFRRRGYAAVRALGHTVKPGYQCLFTMNKVSLRPTFEEIRQDVEALMGSARMVKMIVR